MVPYSRPKLSDFRTLSQTKQLENHTLHSGTYPYGVYMGVPPPRGEYAPPVNSSGFLVLLHEYQEEYS